MLVQRRVATIAALCLLCVALLIGNAHASGPAKSPATLLERATPPVNAPSLEQWSFRQAMPHALAGAALTQILGENLIQNGSFETGEPPTPWYDSISGWTDVIPLDSAPDGTYVARLGGDNDTRNNYVQEVTMPAGGSLGVYIHFWVTGFGQELSYDYDTACAGLFRAGESEPVLDLGCLDGAELPYEYDADQWWEAEYLVVGDEWCAIKGETLYLVLEMMTDSSDPTTVLVDDVNIWPLLRGDATDPQEPNDCLAEAKPIVPGVAVQGLTINPDGDLDVFTFDAAYGDTLIVDVDAAVQGSALDAYAWLLYYDGLGLYLVCEGDDDEISFDPYLECPAPAAGTYVVVITSLDGLGDTSYTYALTIDAVGVGEPTPTRKPTATDTPSPTPTETLQPTNTPTPTLSPTATATTEPGVTRTPTTTPTATASPTAIPSPSPSPTGRSWTAMIYLDGDNNLCRFQDQIVPRLGREVADKIGPNGFLNILVLFDGHPNYCAPSAGTMQYHIQPNGTYTTNVNRWDKGELNMGDPQTLTDFVTWAMRNYPAEHYFLAIEDHGDGTQGVAWDETSNDDNLTTTELYTALKRITNGGKNKIDLLTYEACLMGMYEVAYDIRDFADYVLFFQSISWANDASYPAYMSNTRFTRTTDARTFGEIIFDVYYAAVSSPYAISLIDTSKMGDVHTAVNTLADALRAGLPGNRTTLTSARSATQKIEVDQDWQITDRDWYLDLWHLADRAAAQGLAPAAAAQVKSAVEAAVVREAYRPPTYFFYPGLNYANTHGLSIYWPAAPGGDYGRYVDDHLFRSTTDGTWDEFLEAYFGGRARGGLPVKRGPVERLPATTVVALPIVMG